MGLLARAGFAGRAEFCPHPDARAACAILVQGGRRPMVLCPTCKETLMQLITDWHGRRLGVREVYAQTFALGYTRGDAVRFLLQLAWDRLLVRVGFLREVDL
jgi:hypothetical protein